MKIIMRDVPNYLVRDFTITKIKKHKWVPEIIIKGLCKIVLALFFDTKEENGSVILLVSLSNLVVIYSFIVFFSLVFVYALLGSYTLPYILLQILFITLMTFGFMLWHFLVKKLNMASTIESLEIYTQIIIGYIIFNMLVLYIFMIPLTANILYKIILLFNLSLDQYIELIAFLVLNAILDIVFTLILTYYSYFKIYSLFSQFYIRPHLVETAMQVLEQRDFEITKHKLERYWNMFISTLTAILFTILGFIVGVFM